MACTWCLRAMQCLLTKWMLSIWSQAHSPAKWLVVVHSCGDNRFWFLANYCRRVSSRLENLTRLIDVWVPKRNRTSLYRWSSLPRTTSSGTSLPNTTSTFRQSPRWLRSKCSPLACSVICTHIWDVTKSFSLVDESRAMSASWAPASCTR